MKHFFLLVLAAIFMVSTTKSNSHDMIDIVKQVKPSVVGIGVYTPLSQPQNELRGTGFAVGDGLHVVTNQHVLPEILDESKRQKIVAFVGSGKTATTRIAEIIATSKFYDLAILKIEGEPLPAMSLAIDDFYLEGSNVGFTGFPIGAVLGLYPVTHKAMIASVTPVVIPVKDTRHMTINMLKRLRQPYMVYQLDGTAYPGNSGSAMYDTSSGKVIGVVNKVFVQQTKEAVISNPSGITYAIPVRHLRKLMKDNNVPLN